MLSLGKESVLTNANGDIGKADCYCPGELLSMFVQVISNRLSYRRVGSSAHSLCLFLSGAYSKRIFKLLRIVTLEFTRG